MADRIKEALKDEIRDLKDKLRRAESALAAYEPAVKPPAGKKRGARKARERAEATHDGNGVARNVSEAAS